MTQQPITPLNKLFEGKKILVFGGTGSLGTAFITRVLSGTMGAPESVIVFSRDEAKQHDMRLRFWRDSQDSEYMIYLNSQRLLKFIIGDVRDYYSVRAAVSGVDIVIFASALKQVPLCEYFPFEAVRTNVIGIQNVTRAVAEVRPRIDVVVGISTDKACKPVNVMGMTKALQERILVVSNMNTEHTRFTSVRYGNVLMSRGSVIPFFLEQIRNRQPLTVTNKNMTRFFITLDKAIDTICGAIQLGNRGDTFIPLCDSGRIIDLAHILAERENLEVNKSSIRPGEKIHEVLISEEESFRSSKRENFYVIAPTLPELHQTDGTRLELPGGEYSSETSVLSKDEFRDFLIRSGVIK